MEVAVVGSLGPYLTTEQERHTTGKRAERTERDFRCQFAALPLVKPVVWFARPVVYWRSRSVGKSAYFIYSDNTRALIDQELCLQESL